MFTLFARYLGVEVTEEDLACEKERLAKRFSLASPAAWDEWRAQNKLTEEELRTLTAELAMCRIMHRWQMSVHYVKANTRLLLDELRLRGEYPRWLSMATLEAESLDPDFVDSVLNDTTPLQELLDEHVSAIGIAIEASPTAWREECGFQTWDDVRIALLRSRNLRILLERARTVLSGQEFGADSQSFSRTTTDGEPSDAAQPTT